MKLIFFFLFFSLIFCSLIDAEKLPQIEILVEKKSICLKEIETLDKCLKDNNGGEGNKLPCFWVISYCSILSY